MRLCRARLDNFLTIVISSALWNKSPGGCMTAREGLNEVDQLVMLALVRLNSSAYGVTIRAEIEGRSGRSVSMAAVYSALDRLERRGCAESWLSGPTSERGGRAKKHFKITVAGATQLRDARGAMARMWDGLEMHPDLSAP
jgi:DNA-binding PadR family transcriptional regulator